MCKEVEISKDSPLFVLSNKKAVTNAQFQNKLRLCIRKIGLDPNCFSTHGFRRGGTSLAFRAHISSDKIKLMGDWKSDCYRQYLAFVINRKRTKAISSTFLCKLKKRKGIIFFNIPVSS